MNQDEFPECGFYTQGHGAKRKVRMSPLYNVWASMKSRCLNPKHRAWAKYGGRGIYVCHEWMAFKAFHDWAMSNGYRRGLYIDRENNNMGYCPENCRWVTPQDSVRNRRTSKVTFPIAQAIRADARPATDVASEYGLNERYIREIRSNRVWSTP